MSQELHRLAYVVVHPFPIAVDGHSKVVEVVCSQAAVCLAWCHEVIKDRAELFLVTEDALTQLDPVLDLSHLMFISVDMTQHL